MIDGKNRVNEILTVSVNMSLQARWQRGENVATSTGTGNGIKRELQ